MSEKLDGIMERVNRLVAKIKKMYQSNMCLAKVDLLSEAAEIRMSMIDLITNNSSEFHGDEIAQYQKLQGMLNVAEAMM